MKKLKIAYFSSIMFSDIDLSFLREAQSLADIDYFVPVFKSKYIGAAINVKNVYNKNGVFKATDIYPELKPLAILVDPNHFFIVNSFSKHGWSIQNLCLYARFIWSLRHYDVIHITDFPKFYEIPLYLLRRKVILTVHDPIPHSTAKCNAPAVLKARKWGFRLLQHFIFLNAAQKDECIALNHLEHKNIYDSQLSRYDYLQMYKKQIPANNGYFLFFGQIASNKGINFLLEATKQVHTTHPNIRLIVAGKGDFPFDISEYQKLDYIEFRNRFIPDSELAELIQGSYCVVCPYKDATQSGVVMSAFAFNKPVIASNVGALPEQVINNRYGLIIPPCDSNAIAQAIRSVLDNPNKITEYSNNIQNDYTQGSKSWNSIATQLLNIYEDIYRKA